MKPETPSAPAGVQSLFVWPAPVADRAFVDREVVLVLAQLSPQVKSRCCGVTAFLRTVSGGPALGTDPTMSAWVETMPVRIEQIAARVSLRSFKIGPPSTLGKVYGARCRGA